MPARIVDASVLAALAFQESRAEEARELLREVQLYAPDLLPYELANAAVKKIRAQPESAREIIIGLQQVFLMKINVLAVGLSHSMEVALRTGLTGYDAAYLALSEESGYPLLTFDQRLARNAASRS